MTQMSTDPAVLAREAANFDRIADELKAVVTKVEAIATQFKSDCQGFAGDAIQTAFDRYRQAAMLHVVALNDISTNIQTAGVHYTAADEEAARRLASQMGIDGGTDDHNGHDVQLVDHWKESGGHDDVPGPNPGDPPYATGEHPTLSGDPHDVPPMHLDPGSSDTVKLADNPPGYTGPAGPQRDAAWLAYLSQQSGGTSGTITPTLVLPNPAAVSDPGLKTVGAATKQQGVSYAWGGGHPDKAPVPGVTTGTLNSVRDDSWKFHDNGRVGFDCSGLSRFATYEGHGGLDISVGNSGNTVGQFGALTAPGGGGTVVLDSALKPGDLIYYGPKGASHHVAIYAGNGLVIQAHNSGVPVEVSPMDQSEEHYNVHVTR